MSGRKRAAIHSPKFKKLLDRIHHAQGYGKTKEEPQSILNKLVQQDAIDWETAEALDELDRVLKKGEFVRPPTEDQIDLLLRLLSSVTAPADPRARRTHERDRWMSLELAYYKSRGNPAARQKIARNYGVDLRTVDRAAQRHPTDLPANKEPDETMLAMFVGAHKLWGRTATKKPRHELH